MQQKLPTFSSISCLLKKNRTMEYKIYTKTGDAGETSLIGGRRLPKYDQQIEAYGTVDELNSFIGLIRDLDVDPHTKEILTEIQDRLFTFESLLAEDKEKQGHRELPQLSEIDIQLLESEIDKMNVHLPDLKSFVLPGGHFTASYAHVARTICRRAERVVLKLSKQQDVNKLGIKYLNRLSDYLFVLARKLVYDNQGTEIPWKPRL
jgi:cob(I)alamin adenosyltransferase